MQIIPRVGDSTQRTLDGGTGAGAATPSPVPPTPTPAPTQPPQVQGPGFGAGTPTSTPNPLSGMAAVKKPKTARATGGIVNPEVPVAPAPKPPKSDFKPAATRPMPKTPRLDVPSETALPTGNATSVGTPRPLPRNIFHGTGEYMTPQGEKVKWGEVIPYKLQTGGFNRPAGVMRFLQGLGAVNAFPKGSVKANAKFTVITSLLALAPTLLSEPEPREEYVDWLVNDLNYPRDYAQEWADAGAQYVTKGTVVAQVAGAMVDQATRDFQVSLGFGLAAAPFGAPAGGIGVFPAFFVGASVGRLVSGVSSVIDMFVEPIINQIAGKQIGTDEWIDIPTIYNVIPFNKPTSPRKPEQEKNTDMVAVGAGLTFEGFSRQMQLTTNPDNRYLSPMDYDAEVSRYRSNFYNLNGTIKDPKLEQTKTFFTEGYFVFKTEDGKFGIDHTAYDEFRYKTIPYLRDEDARKFLPPLSDAGKEWSESRSVMTREDWETLWMNSSY